MRQSLSKTRVNLYFHGEDEIIADEQSSKKIEQFLSNKTFTSFVIGFHHKKDGHAIYIQTQPSYKIFDANAGVMEHHNSTSLLTSLSSHIQKLQQDSENPIESITLKKFSDPSLLQEIDIVN